MKDGFVKVAAATPKIKVADTQYNAEAIINEVKALAADVLNIKPVMGSDPDGNIVQLDKARGMKKALDKMVTQMFKNAGNTEEKVLAISHCNCPERAEWVKELALSKGTFKDCFIVDTRGISSLYANDGGIIMVV